MSELDEARSAQSKLLHRLRRYRDVSGVAAIIRGDDRGFVLVVNLTRPLRWWHRPIPTTFDGFPVETRIIGEVFAL